MKKKGSFIGVLFVALGFLPTIINNQKNKKKMKILCENLSYCFNIIFGNEETNKIPIEKYGKLNRLTNQIYSHSMSKEDLINIFYNPSNNFIEIEKSKEEIHKYKQHIDFIIDWLEQYKDKFETIEEYHNKILISGIGRLFDFNGDDYNLLREKLGVSDEWNSRD